MFELPLLFAGSVAAIAGSVFVYARYHPVTAERMSRMHAECSGCHGRHEWRDSGLCRECEHEQIAPMPDYE